MTTFKRFDKDAILTDPCLSWVYFSLTELAIEFATLGFVNRAKTMVSLLLAEYASDWQVSRIRYLKFAFAETGQWPGEIASQDRTEEMLNRIQPQYSPELKHRPEAAAAAQDDAEQLERLLTHAQDHDESRSSYEMERSSALADALEVAIRLASQNTSSIEVVEADPKVQEVLGRIARRLHANSGIEYLTERRGNWLLLATGALARKALFSLEEVDAIAQEVIATFSERFQNGRHLHHTETMSIRELLEEMERNTKAHSVGFYEDMGEEVPDSLFNPPATDRQISALEHKLNITLPDDYKAFLKISNGFGEIWNGIYPDSPLSTTDEVDWAKLYCDDVPVELHEPPNGSFELELPQGRQWPSYQKPLEIGLRDTTTIWFLLPHETKQVIAAYSEAMENPDLPDEIKRSTRKVITARYGSWEAFEKSEWIVLEREDICTVPYGGFTQFLHEKARESAMRHFFKEEQ